MFAWTRSSPPVAFATWQGVEFVKHKILNGAALALALALGFSTKVISQLFVGHWIILYVLARRDWKFLLAGNGWSY